MQAYCKFLLKFCLKIAILALKLLKSSYPNIILLATREGDYSDELKAFAQAEGVRDHVTLLGMCKTLRSVDSHLRCLYFSPVRRACWISAFRGNGVRETCYCNRYRIWIEAITDGENGLLVAPEAELVAAKIDLLLQDREYAERLGRCAKKTVEERFTWEQAAERFLEIYGGSQ